MHIVLVDSFLLVLIKPQILWYYFLISIFYFEVGNEMEGEFLLKEVWKLAVFWRTFFLSI